MLRFNMMLLLNKCSLPSISSPEDVQALVSGKLALRYAGRQVLKHNPFYLPIIVLFFLSNTLVFLYQNTLHF